MMIIILIGLYQTELSTLRGSPFTTSVLYIIVHHMDQCGSDPTRCLFY